MRDGSKHTMSIRGTTEEESVMGEIERVRDLGVSAHEPTARRGETHAYLIRAAERSSEICRERIAHPAGRTGVGTVGPGVRP